MRRTIETIVQSNGQVEVPVPELKPGDSVSVTIEPLNGHAKRYTVREVLDSCAGHRAFKTAEEVDAYIREERDSWSK